MHGQTSLAGSLTLMIGKERQVVSHSLKNYRANIQLAVLPTTMVRKSVGISHDFGTRTAVEWISLYKICREGTV